MLNSATMSGVSFHRSTFSAVLFISFSFCRDEGRGKEFDVCYLGVFSGFLAFWRIERETSLHHA